MCPKKALTVFIGILLSVAGMVSPLFGAETKRGGAMELKSSAFQNGGEIPRKYTCDANDVSPSLSWLNAPAGTSAFGRDGRSYAGLERAVRNLGSLGPL